MVLESLFSILFSTIDVFFITISLVAVGHRVMRLLGFQTPIFAASIAYGLSSFIFIAYYAYLLNIPLYGVLGLLILGGLCLSLVDIYRDYQKNDSASHRIFSKENTLTLLFILIAFFVLNLLAFRSFTVGPGSIGNNDIYYWTASADQLLNKFQFSHVLPNGWNLWGASFHDAIGTDLAVALAAFQWKLSNPALLNASLFLGAIVSWIGLTMVELVMSLFELSRRQAVIVACIVIFSAFFQYITYNFFAGELLATFALLVLVQVGLVLFLRKDKAAFSSTLLKLFPLFALIIISYQAGFLPFFAIFNFYLLVLLWGISQNIGDYLDRVKRFVGSVLVNLGIAFLCYPSAVWYLYQRSLAVASSTDGWSLFLLNGFQLFIFPAYAKFGASSFEWGFLCNLATILVGLLVLAWLVKKIKRYYSVETARIIALLGVAFGVTVILYLLAYAIKGHIYQVWKLAAFMIMPFDFIPVALTMRWALSLPIGPTVKNLCLLFMAIIFMAVAHTLSGHSDLPLLNQFLAMKSSFKDNETLILDLAENRETNVAFNVFSGSYRVIPVSSTYIQKAPESYYRHLQKATWISCQPQCEARSYPLY